jgi:hypothetical protein
LSDSCVATNARELLDAVASDAKVIEVQGTVSGMPMITLRPGVELREGVLEFGAKGVRLTAGNTLDGVTVRTADDEVALLNDTSISDLGTLALRNVTTAGQVLLLAEDAVRSGHVVVEGLHVERADVRGRAERPHGFGVEALQGGFTRCASRRFAPAPSTPTAVRCASRRFAPAPSTPTAASPRGRPT